MKKLFAGIAAVGFVMALGAGLVAVSALSGSAIVVDLAVVVAVVHVASTLETVLS